MFIDRTAARAVGFSNFIYLRRLKYEVTGCFYGSKVYGNITFSLTQTPSVYSIMKHDAVQP